MPGNFKDYPIYVYDDPAIYNKFTGGINTNPNNDHLENEEMRDCLNMTYNSAGLIKRNGAKKLCTISCDDTLINIQNIFLFTYKLTYIIISADGKLYRGVYNESLSIKLERVPVYFDYENRYALQSHLNLIQDLPIEYNEIKNTMHNGYIHRCFIKQDGTKIQGNLNVYDFIKDVPLNQELTNCVLKYNDAYYYLNDRTIITKENLHTPLTDNNEYWVPATQSNLILYKDKVINFYKNNNVTYKLNIYLNYISIIDLSTANKWVENYSDYKEGEIINYNNSPYLCIKTHNIFEYNYTQISSLDILQYRDSLIFQNKRKIEMATYNNKCYIATGTRFIELYLHNNNLIAYIITPYECTYNEIKNLGFNLISPYPSLCMKSVYDQATTTLNSLIVEKNNNGSFLLKPIMTYGESITENDLSFKWEKYINNEWVTIISYKDNYNHVYTLKEDTNINDTINEWDAHTTYYIDDIVMYNDNDVVKLYKCIYNHNIFTISNEENFSEVITIDNLPIRLWKDVSNEITLNNSYKESIIKNNYSTLIVNDANLYKYRVSFTDEFEVETNDDETNYYSFNNIKLKYQKTKKLDLISNTISYEDDLIEAKLTASFGQASSNIYRDMKVNDYFYKIHSCNKILLDGMKLILYGDTYNSGVMYKTKIDNPYYISELGCLSFKTTKNEELVKIIPFSGNLIAFANSENIGGSIHLISGNGDDYSNDEYYSPYKRTIISESVSCDNINTIQVCENYLFFKYFNTVYYIISSDLSNEVINLYSANDKIKYNSQFVSIPWEDNTCISEVTEDYYALIWKEKYILENGELILEHPGMRLKLYYKTYNNYNNKIYFPWLRDESKYFSSDYILYIKGKPIYLYNNLLISFNDNNVFTDLDNEYECMIHFRGVDTNYPKLNKLLNNILIYYYNDTTSKLNMHVVSTNEAGYKLLDSKNHKLSLQDLRTLKTNDKIDDRVRLDKLPLASKVFNVDYRFPYLIIETILSAKSKSLFALSSLTYTYTSIDTPDKTMFDEYANIIRKKEI